MMGDLATSVLLLCFVAGCVVRVSRAVGGQRRGKAKDGTQAEQRVRLLVRRPAVDMPVEGMRANRPDHDPLLP